MGRLAAMEMSENKPFFTSSGRGETLYLFTYFLILINWKGHATLYHATGLLQGCNQVVASKIIQTRHVAHILKVMSLISYK